MTNEYQTGTGPINTRTAWRPILRPIARLLIAAQLALVLQPLSALAQEKQNLFQPIPLPPALQSISPQPGVAPLRGQQTSAPEGDKFRAAEKILGEVKRAKADEKPGKLRALKQVLEEARTAAGDIRAEFAASRADLQKRNLSPEILTRHDRAVTEFEQRAIRFNQIASGPSDDEIVAGLTDFFKQFRVSKRHNPVRPNALPWSSPSPTKRLPAETNTAWIRNLNPGVQLAQAGSLTRVGGVQFTIPPEPGQAPQDTDLAETPDVHLTAAIRAKAQELGNNPVTISNWVRNNIQWAPTWGGMQEADGTLQALKGNAFDTASLTIALLRAAGIPARYQFGTIDLPAEQVMNWVGGAPSPAVALNLLAQGGIAARGIASGGRIATIRMEHVWVNAYVNWTPSRGNRQGGNTVSPPVKTEQGQPQHPNPNAQLNAWVPIDSSFKQHAIAPGIDIEAVIPVDAGALTDALKQGATVTADYVQNLNQVGMQTQLDSYQNLFQSYLKGVNPNAGVADVIGARTITQRNPSLLAGVTPYAVVAKGSESAAVPDALRWKVGFLGYALDGGGGQGPTLLDRTFNLADLISGRVGVTYEGSTPADQQAIASYRSTGATSFPAYAIHVKPLFQIDGNTVETGPSIGMALDVQWDVSIIPPGQSVAAANRQTYAATAGDEMVWAVVADAVSAQQVQSMYFPATAAGNLHAVGMSFWHQADTYAQLIARREHALAQRMPSLGVISSALTVQYIWGIPRNAFYRNRTMDIGHSSIGAQGMDGAKFQRELGVRTSWLEGSIFDQVFSRESGTALSAVRVIQAALEAGQRVYTLNSGNADQYLGLIEMSSEVREDIINSLLMGLEVTIPQYNQQIDNWQGTGYIVVRAETGAGSYNLSGGQRGADEGSDCELKPATSPAKSANFAPAILFAAAIIAAYLVFGAVVAVPLALMVMATSTAAAPAPQLPPHLSGLWNQVGGGQPWPTQFNWPPAGSYLERGLCSEEQHASLVAAKKLACKGNLLADAPCKDGDSCIEVDAKIEAKKACIDARLEEMNSCYQGGDSGHWQQIRDKLNAVTNCDTCRAKLSAQQCRAL